MGKQVRQPKPRRNRAYRRRGKHALHTSVGFLVMEPEFLLQLQQEFFDASTHYMRESWFIEVAKVPFVSTPIR